MEADRLATEAMRSAMDEIEMHGTIVIGEGERDEAPMLYIGEEVGVRTESAPEIDIAVDPLEGTNLVATGSPNAITVLAASEKGGLVHAPDTYLEKLCVGPLAAGHVDIRDTPTETVNRIAEILGRKVGDIAVVILDRPRHEALIAEVRATGARIKLISDGDLSAAISCAVQGTGVHAVTVHPGGVKTNIVRNARYHSYPNQPNMDHEEFSRSFESIAYTTPAKAARTIHEGVKAGKSRILVGPDAYLFDALARGMPTRYYDVLARLESFASRRT